MKAFLEGLHRWYLRRFKGIVKPPERNPQGTTWQQHGIDVVGFTCRCGVATAFDESDLKILSQEHIEGCEGIFDMATNAPAKGSTRAIDLVPCNCPVTEARYVKICPQCRLGHWKQAKP